MERGSRDLSGAKDSCSTSGEGAEKDKDVDSHSNESEDEEHSDTHSHSTANVNSGMYESDGDGYRLESISPVKYLEELSESKTMGMISASQISPPGAKDSGGNRKKIGRYFTDRIYLDKMSRQERRRIEGEMIKGRKPALTVQNIVQELRGVDLFKVVGRNILDIPSAKVDELKAAHHSTDQQEAAVVRYWLLRDPLASWRRIIYQLDELVDYSGYGHYSDIADRIRHYAEELTDTTFTHSNLSTVLNHVVDMNKLMYCLSILGNVKEKIREHSKDEEQQRDEYIHYYCKFSPFAMWGWGYLGGELHYREIEAAALTAAKAYIQRAPDPTLILDTVTSVLDGVQLQDMGDGGGIADWLQIPVFKQNELHAQYDRRQRPRAYSTYFLAEHPTPSWRIIALALWECEELGALEVVQKLYLKGSSQSRRLFEQSMKRGYVDLYADKMLLYGSAGVGKTCTMKIVAGEKPPDVRNSTPVATRPVTMYQLQKMGGKWHKYVSQDRMKLCARISKTTLGREVIEALIKSKLDIEEAGQRAPDQEVDGGSEQRTSTTANRPQPAMVSVQQSENSTPKTKAFSTAPSQTDSIDPNVLQVIHDVLDEMFQLIDECPETEEPLSYIHKLLVSDCGGQPQFHEVLPIFLRRMSLILFVFKLSEDFTSRPMIEYYEEGMALGSPYESDHTTEQLIKQGLQSLHSHRSSKDSGKDSESPRIVMVGTHKDEENRCSESREMKNQKLREMLLPTFEKEIIYYQPGTDQVLFPMNAKCPGKEEEDMAQAIVSKFSTKNRSDKRQLPLQWLGFEIMLEEITLRLERGILSRNECLEIAHRLHIDESALDAALIYLDELSLVFYYPDILPEVIFTNPQVLLDKISELVKVHHDKLMKYSGKDWQQFFSHALVKVEFLKQKVFKKHYVSGLFEPEQLAILYQKLLIFADFPEEGKFFVPSLLRMLSNKEVADQRLSLDSVVAPLVLHFPDGPPRRGIFCALVSFFTSIENHFPGPWKLKKPARSVTPTCLHRNCIQFTVPGFKTACAITLIDTLLHFEVHFNVKSKEDAFKFCPVVKQALSAGLRKANLVLGYTNSTPSFALLCPCGEGDPHPATFGDRLWICSSDGEVGDKLDPNQLLWLKEITHEVSAGDTANSSTATASKACLHGLESGLNMGNGEKTKPDDQRTDTSSSESKSDVQSETDTSSVSKQNGGKRDNNGHSLPASISNTVQGTTKEDSGITLEEIAAKAGIDNLSIFDQESSQKILLNLSQHCVDWTLIGLYLDLTRADIAAVNGDYQTVDEKRAGMLGRWKEKFAFKATYRVFIEALLACGKAEDAVDACKTIAKDVKASLSCGMEHLSKAFKQLLPLASEWESIGLCLGLDNFEDSVKASAKTAPSCLKETLKLWLNRVDPCPNWKELAEAVEPFDSDIAAKIKAL